MTIELTNREAKLVRGALKHAEKDMKHRQMIQEKNQYHKDDEGSHCKEAHIELNNSINIINALIERFKGE